MTKTAAIRQATDEISMRPQGAGWIVQQYDEEARATREDHERPYSLARQIVTDLRVERALRLLGLGDDPSFSALSTDGSLADRVDRALETTGRKSLERAIDPGLKG